jgi:hypothetical protein
LKVAQAPASAPRSTGDWLKTHKQEALLGAGGIVVAIALYVRSKNSSSSSSSTPPTYAVADTTPTDLSSQIDALGQAIANLQPAGSSNPPTAVNIPAQVTVGSGLGPASGPGSTATYSAGGVTYGYVPSQAAAESLLGAGQSLYYEPAPGDFVQELPGVAYAPGTPTWAKEQ